MKDNTKYFDEIKVGNVCYLEPIVPFCTILVHEKLKCYMLLLEDDLGDGDTYVLNDLIADGWEEFCNTQRGYHKAIKFMENFYPEYKRLKYELHQYPLHEVKEFIDTNHRHHNSPQGCNFAMGVKLGGSFIGVITAGRPVARYLQDGKTLEITRVCVKKGYRNLCSFLYSSMIKVAKDLGYEKVITYTLDSESGASCKAAGFQFMYVGDGGSWNSKSRPRVDKHPTGKKVAYGISLL